MRPALIEGVALVARLALPCRLVGEGFADAAVPCLLKRLRIAGGGRQGRGWAGD